MSFAPAIAPLHPMHISARPRDWTADVTVLMRDGTRAQVSSTDLVRNAAWQRWVNNPQLPLRECNLRTCVNPNTCRFAHLAASSGSPNPAVASTTPVEPVRNGVASVPPPPTNEAPVAAAPFVPPHLRPLITGPLPPMVPSSSAPPAAPPRHSVANGVAFEALLAFQRHAIDMLRLQRRIPGGLARQSMGTQTDTMCILCCEEPTESRLMHTCNNHHNTCGMCLAQYILTNWRDNRTVSGDDLRCCHPGCVSNPVTTEEVVRIVSSKAALEVYINHRVRQTAAQCYADAHALVVADPVKAVDTLFQKQLQRSMTAARMCPQCKFGPIDFFGCDDLVQHHNDRPGASNSCPQCGFFAPRVAAWDRWDGITRGADASSRPTHSAALVTFV